MAKTQTVLPKLKESIDKWKKTIIIGGKWSRKYAVGINFASGGRKRPMSCNNCSKWR
jgi:hypothetical protein